jgi:release factor glutamine methyltransferase
LIPYFNHQLEQYYHQHQSQLECNYPGISLRLLHETLNQLSRSPSPSTLNYLLNKLQAGVPLAYIVQERYFFSSTFIVTPDVLIPRFESEVLVESAIEVITNMCSDSDQPLTVCDVGCGTGAIILSLMVEGPSPIKAVAIDIDNSALNVARDNLFRLQYKIDSRSSLELHCQDRLANFDHKFHLVVSNPPYIKREEDASQVHPQVFKHEPHLALFLPDDSYLEWFASFFSQVYDHLLPGGVFLMEGHERHLKYFPIMLEKCGFDDIAIMCDLTGQERLIRAQRGTI